MVTVREYDFWFGQVDSRPFALFRIGYGALLLKQILYLLPVVQLFYSDEGIVPRAQFWPDPAQAGLGQFSLLNYVGTSWAATLFLWGWAAIAVALLVGYRTRLMVLLTFLAWLSLQHRNPFVLHAPDHVMMVLSFWLIFLPLNQHYAVDQWLARRRQQLTAPLPTITYAFPLRVIQIQIALIYLLTSYYKWQGLFWRTGDAMFYSLQRESFLLPTGLWLGMAAPLWLLRLLTWSTLLIEASFAFLVFMPVGQPWAKITALLLATLLHIGIGLSMAIPDFSLVMILSYLLFFEPSWLQRWEAKWRRHHWSMEPPAVSGVESEQPASLQQKVRWLSRSVLTCVLALLLLATIVGGIAPANNVWNPGWLTQPWPIRLLNEQLHLASPWTMFAYYARPRSGELLIQGELTNNTQQLLYSSRAPDTGRMQYLWGPGARLRMFEQRLFWAFPSPILQAWSKYYCRLDQSLASVAIYRRYHWTHAPGAPTEPEETDLLWRQPCSSATTVQ